MKKQSPVPARLNSLQHFRPRLRFVSIALLLCAGLCALLALSPVARMQPAQEQRGIKLGVTPTPTPADGTPGVIATEARPELVMQTGHAMRVDGLAFSPDGQLCATGSKDNTVRLWETATGRELRKLVGHTAW